MRGGKGDRVRWEEHGGEEIEAGVEAHHKRLLSILTHLVLY